MSSQNMTPVYDGAGNLIGYARELPNVSYIIIDNGINFFSKDNSVIMRNPLSEDLLQSIGYTEATKLPIVADPNGFPQYTGGLSVTTGVGATSGVPVTAGIKGGGGDPNITGFRCSQFTYNIGTPRVLSLDQLASIQTLPPTAYLNNPDHADLLKNAKECVLVAPVYECCWIEKPGGPLGLKITNGSTLIGWVLISYAKILVSYEQCYINGKLGKRPILVKYFDYNDIVNGPLGFIIGPDRDPNNPLKSVAPPMNTGSTDWANCFGEYGIIPKGFWGEYINQNQNLLFVIQEVNKIVNESPDGSKYFLTDPTTGTALPSNTFGVLAGFDCQESGECVEIQVPPPPPSKEPTKYCITINSLSVASDIDAGRHIMLDGKRKGQILPAYTAGANTSTLWISGGIRYGSIVYDGRDPFGFNALTKYVELSKTLIPGSVSTVRGERVNLASEGLPCETGIFETTTSSLIEKYSVVRICYIISEEPGKEGRLIGVEIQPGNFGTFDGQTIFTNEPPILDQSTRQYDPNGGCCEKLKWPDNWVRNRDYVIPDPTATVSVTNMPPPNIAYLDHDLSTEELVLKDTCGCEAIPIADIWCYYNGSKKFKWKSKDVNDPSTHTGKPKIVADERCIGDKTRVFHPFDVRRDISFSVRKDKTAGLFDGQQSLECYITSSITSSTSNYYFYAVNDCLDCTKYPYFAVSYGNIKGSGSIPISSDPNTNNKTYSDTIYSQYQLLCNEVTSSAAGTPTVPTFKFVSQSVELESDDIYAINFYREGISDKLDPGNFQINLAYLNGNSYDNNLHTGSNVTVGSTKIMQFIDNSGDFSQGYLCQDQLLESYDIVSGSLENGIYEPATVNTYGKVYPALGVVVLHPKQLNEILGFNTVTGSNIDGDNAYKLFTAISGAASPYGARTEEHPMLARNVKFSVTHHYSVRVHKGMANYSNNPTYVTGSKNRIFDTCFINQPQTYITSVGLYNENLELLAVAKLTRPLKKDFDSDLLIKIRLNW